MRRSLLAIGILALVCFAASPFEGKRFKISLSPDDDASRAGAKAFDATLAFKGNKFSAEAAGKFNFQPVSFEEDTRQVGPATFTAVSKSDAEGTAKWSGSIVATSIRGDLIWTTKDGKVLNFTYTGDRLDN